MLYRKKKTLNCIKEGIILNGVMELENFFSIGLAIHDNNEH